MYAITHEVLTCNAYRVLGLSSGATQADIDAAARRMRIWSDPAQIPPTPFDLPWMGNFSRARGHIEQAFARLSEPATRLYERLFWFATPVGEGSDFIRFWRHAAGTAPTPPDANAAWAPHDAAVLQVAHALIDDPTVRHPKQWARALSGITLCAADPVYRAWFLETEKRGAFEKRATPAECVSRLEAIPSAVSRSIGAMAGDALERGQFRRCIRLLKLMSGLTIEQQFIQACAIDVGNCAEDLLISRCDRWCDELHTRINWDRQAILRNAPSNRRICQKARRAIRREIDPLFCILKALPGEQPERMQRIAIPAARMFRNLGLGWDWGRRFKESGRTLQRARKIGLGTAMEAKLNSDLLDLKRRTSKPFLGAKRGQTSKVWIWAVLLLCSSLGRVFTSMEPTRSTYDRDFSPPPAYHFTRPPQYDSNPPLLNLDLNPPVLPQDGKDGIAPNDDPSSSYAGGHGSATDPPNVLRYALPTHPFPTTRGALSPPNR